MKSNNLKFEIIKYLQNDKINKLQNDDKYFATYQ